MVEVSELPAAVYLTKKTCHALHPSYTLPDNARFYLFIHLIRKQSCENKVVKTKLMHFVEVYRFREK